MTSAWADEPVMSMLKRMNQAASSTNYDGVFIHVSDNQVDTLRIVHRVDGDNVNERLYALNGVPREVIRNADEVWCFMPERKMGVLGARSGKQAGFPGFMISNLEVLNSSYDLHIGETGRIADREVIQLLIQPRDGLRYGYDLWADVETGLLLKSVLIDNEMNPLEQYMFALIDIGGDIPASALKPMTQKSSLQWHTDSQPPRVTSLEDSNWDIASLPRGYRLANIMQRWLPMQDDPVEHMVFTDGLSAVSVFVESAPQGGVETSYNHMGAVSAFTRGIDSWQITAIGEVPEQTVQKIAEALSYKNGAGERQN